MKHLIFLVVWTVILSPVALWAAEDAIPKDTSLHVTGDAIPKDKSLHVTGDAIPKDKSLHVTSDTMISERNAAFVEFVGNARAISRGSVVHADSIKVFLYKDEEKKNLDKEDEQNIKEILATGGVRFISGDRKAFAEKAVYTTQNQTLILTGGSPKVITGESFVTGKKITVFRSNGRVVVESGKKKRVEALFNGNDKIQKKGVE